jgi:O-antigen ligase
MYIYGMLLAIVSIMMLRTDTASRDIMFNIILVFAFIPSIISIFSRLFSDTYLDIASEMLSSSSYNYQVYLMGEGYSGCVGEYIGLSTCYIVCGLAISLSRYYKKHQFSYLLLSLFFAMALIFVNRRSEVIAAFGAFMVLLFLVSNKKGRLIYVSILAIAIILFIILMLCIKFQIITYGGDNRLIKTLYGLMNGEDVSNGRSKLYALAWELFLQNPIFGIGFGNFRSYGSELIGNITNVHNIYLQLLCELGVFSALIIFLAMIFFFIYVYIYFDSWVI